MDRRDYYAAFGSPHFPKGTTFNQHTKTARVPLDDDEGNEEIIEVQYRLEVCDLCDGTGSHVNPSIDAHGITAEEWHRDWDQEEREDYFRGVYDVPCNACHGENVVPVLDTQSNDPALVKRIQQWQQDEAYSRQERAAEMRHEY